MKTAPLSIVFVSILALSCGNETFTQPSPVFENPDSTNTPVPPTSPNPSQPVLMVGAGDIGWCGLSGAKETGELIDSIQGTVFTLGDNAYPNGTIDDFQNCYDPFWGRHRYRTRPALGNHEYTRSGAMGFFTYFGDRVTSRTGYYSYDLGGAWHIIVLNGSSLNNSQLNWLRQDLNQNLSKNVLVQEHYPLVSSGPNGDNPALRGFWQVLQESKADLFLAGHDHLYERFTRLNSDGLPDPSGIRQIVVGTGGAKLYEFVHIKPGSEVRGMSWGVLKLTLQTESYTWEFVPVPGSSFRDFGEDSVIN